MTSLLNHLWNRARSGFWLIPSLFAITACVLSWFLIYLDATFVPNLGTKLSWVFAGSAEGARGLLSAIAGSLFTAVSVIFSVTVVVLQQSSSQYSPRILRNFTQDRGNQMTLGIFLGTFTYSILVMRQIRGSTGGENQFIPSLAVTFAIFLTLVCLGALIYFIHHISHAIQLSTVLNSILREIDAEITTLFPDQFSAESPQSETEVKVLELTLGFRRGLKNLIKTPSRGYIQSINQKNLMKAARSSHSSFIHSTRAVGEYLFPDMIIAEIWTDHVLTRKEERAFINSFSIDSERSIHQDAFFGIRQIVDIAVKALSPGINDPTTAEQCILALGSVLARLLTKKIPETLQNDSGIFYLFNRPEMSEYFSLSFRQIRRSAARDCHVTCTLLKTFEELSAYVPNTKRLELLLDEVAKTRKTFSESTAPPSEKAAVEAVAQQSLETLKEKLGMFVSPGRNRTAA